MPRSVMRKLLQSDPYDPKGYVASFKDERITNLVRAFNFGSDGKIASKSRRCLRLSGQVCDGL